MNNVTSAPLVRTLFQPVCNSFSISQLRSKYQLLHLVLLLPQTFKFSEQFDARDALDSYHNLMNGFVYGIFRGGGQNSTEPFSLMQGNHEETVDALMENFVVMNCFQNF